MKIGVAGIGAQVDAKMAMANSKQIVHLTASATVFVAALFCIIAFSTPHWLVNRGSPNPVFHKLGLWEICLENFHDFTHMYDKTFSGCRWIFDEDYDIIREPLLPKFFVVVQIFYTFGFMILLVSCCLVVALMLCCSSEKEVLTLNVLSILLAVAAKCSLIAVITFGALGDGRDWLPEPDHNFLSWSFGLAVVGTFLKYVAAILFWVEARIIQYRQRKQSDRQSNVFTLTSKDQQYNQTKA